MKSINLKLFSVCMLLIFSSCKKDAGIGGTSSIKGKVYATYFDKTFYTVKDSAYAPGVEVYIIYGGQSTFGSHQKTAYDGTYEFKYLQKGSYKIYAYSQDTTGRSNYQLNIYSPMLPIIKNVDITKRKQTVEVLDIKVNIK